MNPTSGLYGMNVQARRATRIPLFVGTRWAGVAIWGLLVTIFVIDVWTRPENVSPCFAYTIPIFMSLFEARPRPMLYATTATALSLAGSFVEPSGAMPYAAILVNRFIAVATQWLAAILVKVQYRRHVEALRVAELQRRFVDILSHEIGTALTAIDGQAYRLTKLAERLVPADTRLRAEKIRNAAERIEAIVDRVQFASALGDGSIPIGRTAVDIDALLRRLTDQIGEEKRDKPIELTLQGGSVVVQGDETLLRQAFENVVMNSMKYSSADSPVSIRTARQGAFVRVAIADRGKGIAASDLSRIREPYYRGEGSAGISGAGLGLFFVERIVEAHGGKLRLESEVGIGTTVTIELPCSAAPVPG